MSEPLEKILERTGNRASLASEYLDGHAPATQRKDGHSAPDQPTYYDLPPVKKPDWKWYVPAYFFVGGLSSGAYIVATLADIIGRPEERSIVRAGRLIALLGMLVSPILLIADLGRPERFLSMLRVFKPRSMMNQGSWALAVMGLFSGIAAFAQALENLAPRRLARLIVPLLRRVTWLGIVPAMFVGSYTGVLLTTTSVALWARNHLLMGPLFLSSALSTGLAAIHLATRLLGRTERESEERIETAERIVLGAELAVTVGSGLMLRGFARPLLVGPLARTYQVGSIVLGLLVPLALLKWDKRPGPITVLGSALTLVGGLIMRFAIVEAGKQSADDPRAYFAHTKAAPRR